MPWRRFLVFNSLGAVLWVGVWAGLGYLAGNHITAIYEQIHRYQLYALLAIGLVLAALTVRHVVRRRRASEETLMSAKSPSRPRPGQPRSCGRCTPPGS